VFRFQHPSYLWLLIVWVLFFVLFLGFLYWRKNKIAKAGSAILINKLIRSYSLSFDVIKFVFFSLSYVSLIIALANPQIGTRQEKVTRSGIDLIVALDVSKSMLAEDVSPNRLSKAKNFVSRFIDQLNNDRLGLVVFAGRAYLQMPLTVDYAASKMYLKSLSPAMVPTQGTAVGEAVSLATQSFSKEENTSKAILVISDGEDNEEGALNAINDAAEKGIKVYTLSVGTTSGSPIPLANGDYKRDGDGNIVLSKVNTDALREYAVAGKGKFYQLDNTTSTAQQILKDLGKLDKNDFEEMVYTDYDDQFIYFLILALIFIVLDFLWPRRKVGV
jgi:Ca-activated chloride channel family protein